MGKARRQFCPILSRNLGSACFCSQKNGDSLAADCRSSFISVACLFVPGVNLVFSCLMDCLVMEKDASGLGIPYHQVSRQQKQIVDERS